MLYAELFTVSSAIQDFRKKIKDEKAKNPGKQIPLIPFSAVNIGFTQTGLTLVSGLYRLLQTVVLDIYILISLGSRTTFMTTTSTMGNWQVHTRSVTVA